MKGIKILIFVVVILAVILGLKMSGIISGKSSEKEIMTQEEIISLIKKATEYNNIYIQCISSKDSEVEIFKKDNIIVHKMDSGLIWINSEIDEILLFADNKAIKNAVPYMVEPLQNQKNIIESIEEGRIKIEYKGLQLVNEKETIIVNIHTVDGTETQELMIDKETGIIWDDMYIYFSVGTVTDEDVKKPDLTKYEVVNANEI